MSRAAMAMDTYEFAYTNLDYQYDPSYVELPLKKRIINKSLYIIQFLMVGGALLVIAGTLMAERNGLRFCPLPFGTMEKELLYVPFACAAFSVVTAVVGCAGATVRNKWLLVLYLICVGSSFVLGVASTVQPFVDSSNVFYYAQRQWRKLTRVQEIQFQQQFKCCNFITKGPCCRFEAGTGECANTHVCFDRVSSHLLDNFEIISTMSFIHSVYLFVVSLGAVILLKYLDYKNTKEAANKRKNKSEAKYEFDLDDPDYFR
eukprot:166312_1